MNIRFDQRRLERMAIDAGSDGGLAHELAESYRRIVQFIVESNDERDLYAWKALHFEKLKGARAHQRSMRLNRQFRLILEMHDSTTGRFVAIKAIEDYH